MNATTVYLRISLCFMYRMRRRRKSGFDKKAKNCWKFHKESIMETRSKSREEQENGGQSRYMMMISIIKMLICLCFKGNIEKVVVIWK